MTDQFAIPLERTANVPITEGVHPFVVKEVEESESQNNNPMLVVTLACETPGEEGKEVRMFLVLTQNARWKLEAFLDAIKAPASGSAVASQFIGRRLRANITHKDYEGRMQAQVGEMFPMSVASSAPKPVVASGGKVATKAPVATAVGKTQAKAAKPTAPQPPAGLPKDAPEGEIPFG